MATRAEMETLKYRLYQDLLRPRRGGPLQSRQWVEALAGMPVAPPPGAPSFCQQAGSASSCGQSVSVSSGSVASTYRPRPGKHEATTPSTACSTRPTSAPSSPRSRPVSRPASAGQYRTRAADDFVGGLEGVSIMVHPPTSSPPAQSSSPRRVARAHVIRSEGVVAHSNQRGNLELAGTPHQMADPSPLHTAREDPVIAGAQELQFTEAAAHVSPTATREEAVDEVQLLEARREACIALRQAVEDGRMEQLVDAACRRMACAAESDPDGVAFARAPASVDESSVQAAHRMSTHSAPDGASGWAWDAIGNDSTWVATPRTRVRPSSAPAGGRRPEPPGASTRLASPRHRFMQRHTTVSQPPAYGSIYAQCPRNPGPGHYNLGRDHLKHGPICFRAARQTGEWFVRKDRGPSKPSYPKSPFEGNENTIRKRGVGTWVGPPRTPPTPRSMSFSRARRF